MRRLFVTAAAALCALAGATLGNAVPAAPPAGGDITVILSGAQVMKGEAACRLYNSGRNFPFGKGTAGEVRTRRAADGTACIFRGLEPGNYALVVALLPEGQADITRDLLGRPRQPWGVSNNIRHALRAPRFDEAAFTLETGKNLRLGIALAQ
jgi:uncharacterized protein (DUF2141 family)